MSFTRRDFIRNSLFIGSSLLFSSPSIYAKPKTKASAATAGKAVGSEPIDALVMEDHSDSFIAWRQGGFKGRIVVHIDSHIDLEWVSSADLKRIVNSKTVKALKEVQLDPLHPEERSLRPLSIMNFLYPAMMEGMVKEVYWVAPDSLMTGTEILDKMKFHFIETLDKLSIDDLNSFRIQKASPHPSPLGGEGQGEGVIKGRAYGFPLTICKLSDLPRFNEDVLLDIDVDYFDPPNLGKRLSVPSLWPEELIAILMKKGVKTDCVTVCYSVKGGYLALEYKFLGDDLVTILKDPKGSHSVLIQIREHRKSGHIYRSKGMYSEAAKEFQKGLELSPNDGALHYGLGLVYDQWAKADEASVEFGRAKAIDGKYENPVLYDADYYFQKGMVDRALPLYKQVLQTNPGHLGSLLTAGVCSSRQGATEKAVEYYQSLIERAPDFYLVHFDLGVVYFQLERWEKAEMEYRRAVELNPSFGKAYQNLGLLYLNRGETDRAIGAFEKAVENNPCFKGAHNNLGSLYANAGKYEEAIAAFKKTVRIDPRYAPGYRNLGKTYLLQGKVDDASKAFQQALAINPKDESILQLLDRIHKK
jgi:tetratricopeptide (TPR) repeat protein